MEDISGWTVWITGSGSGIGAAMARAFAGAGCTVALTGRRADALEAVAGDIGDAAHVFPGDVTDRAAMAAIAKEIRSRTGRLDAVCNNAGLNIPNRTWEGYDAASWDTVIDVNVKGALGVVAAVIPIMREAGGGVIINTSSWAGRYHSEVAGVPYGASKHAVSDMSAAINDSEGRHGIRACALCPGEVATEILKNRPTWDASREPYIIQPQDMAEAALFVARMNPNVFVQEVVLGPVVR